MHKFFYKWAICNNYLLFFLVIFLFIFSTSANSAQDPQNGDIRDLKVGVQVNELPHSGYVNFSCVGADAITSALTQWTDFRRCDVNADGLYEVRFQYDNRTQQWAAVNDKWEGTKIAGHPVLLSILIDSAGEVKVLRAQTDPTARPYMRKKAYLLSLRVKARYGPEGWICDKLSPAFGETPIGGLYIHERCEKIYKNRKLILHTELYRGVGQQGQEFTNSTRLEIIALAS